MAITKREWKTEEIDHAQLGRVKITYWNKWKAHEILDAFSKPIEEESPLRERLARALPRITTHQMGRTKLTVQHVPFETYLTRAEIEDQRRAVRDLPELEEVLKETTQRKARAGMPVAFLEDANGNHIITLWKKNTRPLAEYLNDPSISDRQKTEKKILAIRQLVKLHLDGLVHKHPHVGNFLVYDNREVKLVDIGRLGKPEPPRILRIGGEEIVIGEVIRDVDILAESLARIDRRFTNQKVRRIYENYKQYLTKKRQEKQQPTSSP